MSHDSPHITHSRFERRALLAAAVAVAALAALNADQAYAASARELTAEGRAALAGLYASNPKAAELGKRTKAVLVFPNVRKAGAVVGVHGGQGVLLVDGAPRSYYRISAASVGYQLGAQRFSYALFFANDKAIDALHTRGGWAVGTGPSLVLVDDGVAKNMNTMTLKEDVYAMSFGQRGLMAGTGLEGSKITEITPDP